MLSAHTIARLDRLHETQTAFQPLPEIRQELAGKVAVLVVGASCEGKNTLIDAVVQQDERFCTIGTVTSRPPRSSDAGLPYTYYEHSDEGLQPILDDIDAGGVVQYAINPYSHMLYASKIADYPGTYNIGDYFSSAVAPFRTLGFRNAPAVSIITPAHIWLGRFSARFPVGHPDRPARRDEAIESFSWSLAQTTNHYWVINRSDDTKHSAHQLIQAVTRGLIPPVSEAQSIAMVSLETARKLAA